MVKIKCENKELSDQVEKSDVLVVEARSHKKIGKLIKISEYEYEIYEKDFDEIKKEGIICVKMSDKEYHIHNSNEDPVRCICSLTNFE